jgi:CubicO group peptidase (beta-lactamase class C family)
VPWPTSAPAWVPAEHPPFDPVLRRWEFPEVFPKHRAHYNVDPPQGVTALPATYFYSDFSVGLLGLLLGSYPNLPIDNHTLDRWFAMVENSLADPLGMRSTYLEVPSSEAWRVAGGDDRALATATVSNGLVASITVTSPGGSYHPSLRRTLRSAAAAALEQRLPHSSPKEGFKASQ